MGLAGPFLGEINQELPSLGSERKYRIYNAKNELRGKAFGKSAMPAPFLKLTNSENEIIASIEGLSKSFGRESRIFIMTPDNKEIIVTCTAIDQNSYKMKILLHEINQFLILSCYTLSSETSNMVNH